MRPSTPQRLRIEPLLASLGNNARAVQFRRRESIFSQGGRSKSIFYIKSGFVKIAITSKQGKEAVIAVLNRGSFFGDQALISPRPLRSDNATALTDVYALRIEPGAMLRLIHTDDDFCDGIISSLISAKARLSANFGYSLLHSSEKRLAYALRSMAELCKDGGDQPFPKVSQQDLANMIGTSRQRVNVLLKRFKKLGLVDHADASRSVASFAKSRQA